MNPIDEMRKSEKMWRDALMPSFAEYAMASSVQAIAQDSYEDIREYARRASASIPRDISDLVGLGLPSSAAAANAQLEDAVASGARRAARHCDPSREVLERLSDFRNLIDSMPAVTDVSAMASRAANDLDTSLSALSAINGIPHTMEALGQEVLGSSIQGHFAEILDATNYHRQIFDIDAFTDKANDITDLLRGVDVRDSARLALDAAEQGLRDVTGQSIAECLAQWDVSRSFADEWRNRESAFQSEVRKAAELLGESGYQELVERAQEIAQGIAAQLDVRLPLSEAIGRAASSVDYAPLQEHIESLVEGQPDANTKAKALFNAVVLEVAKAFLLAPIRLASNATWLALLGALIPSGSGTEEVPPSLEVAQEAPAPAYNRILVVIPETVNLRAGPGTEHSIVSKLKRSQLLRLISVDGDWGLVLYVDSEKRGVSYTGWIKLSLARTMADETARLLLQEMTAKEPPAVTKGLR